MLSPPRGHVVRPSISTSAASQPRLPGGEFVGRNRERDMHRAVTVMRRNGAAGHMHGLERMAAQKQQQHAAAVNVVRAQPLIAVDAN